MLGDYLLKQVEDSLSTIIRWLSMTANPSEWLEMGTSSLTLADARVSAFLSGLNARSHCIMICECGNLAQLLG
jgi:hypothetical protein